MPIIILSAYAISKVRFSIAITLLYIVWISNIFYPISYSTIIIPERSISHFDFTAPDANFKGSYTELKKVYNNEILIATRTPEGAWYFKNPDYWISFSFTNLKDESYTNYYGKEIYTGAQIISNLEQFESINNKIAVLDDWGSMRIDQDIKSFINNNCTLLINRDRINVYRC